MPTGPDDETIDLKTLEAMRKWLVEPLVDRMERMEQSVREALSEQRRILNQYADPETGFVSMATIRFMAEARDREIKKLADDHMSLRNGIRWGIGIVTSAILGAAGVLAAIFHK